MTNVRVGVGLLIIKDDKYVLIGKRKNSHGNGTFHTPGGTFYF